MRVPNVIFCHLYCKKRGGCSFEVCGDVLRAAKKAVPHFVSGKSGGLDRRSPCPGEGRNHSAAVKKVGQF